VTSSDPDPAVGLERAPHVLRRTRDDRVLAGVCGGLGRYLGIDPVLLRVAFVLLAVFGGSGVLLYLIGLVAIPSEAPGDNVTPPPGTKVGTPAIVIGVVLIAVGGLLLVRQFLPGLGDVFGPLVLVGVGALVILAGRR
jgi:phage shock protein C